VSVVIEDSDSWFKKRGSIQKLGKQTQRHSLHPGNQQAVKDSETYTLIVDNESRSEISVSFYQPSSPVIAILFFLYCHYAA
jgi:phosphoserine aminotransferase